MATFRDLEHAGWTDKAQSYDDHFASITRQAIGPLLQSIGGIADKDLIDICCGTGDLAAAAVSKGARVVGVDFALPMIEIARRKVPGAMFKT
ncbi:MAG TPA: methyltransferase domain-containing protein, partial [Hyphomicrobiaceae bacterium]|nr:methyltransferase domain-containing protein [Hyphomicrobiaceae bacterium]